ncbi:MULTISPECIES: MATE family efflux transporter [Aneurinibacillus]|uniref:MATE family efflux transporter n=2 Tax=Aneurinibacillus danicus TaxID=267746 RepID=A0A511VC53_9BACL|nr:MATE family efflux transporter [Aneurinibacillus danicus]GEN36434.1 MATE family efflux transporter [Aneurinibacillus danicus]
MHEKHIRNGSLSHREYLALAIPLMISTLSTPLLGAVDTAVVGRLSDPAYLGGVAVGTLIFNTMYWLLGFLRVSTSGFSAQAHGANDPREMGLALLRPAMIALAMGLVFIVLQKPIKQASFWMIGAEPSVLEHAESYVDIRIWGAPFALLNYTILGWLMGMSRIKASLLLQISMNVLNIVLAIVLVSYFHMNVAGVAVATLIAEVSAAGLGIWLIGLHLPLRHLFVRWKDALSMQPMVKMMRVNRDLFIRTACLLAVFNLFTAYGASFGKVTLAANAVLLQIHFIMAYFLDGFANASSILVGRSIGEKNYSVYKRTVRLTGIWGAVASVILSAVLYFGNESIISLFTTIDDVKEQIMMYASWVLLFPFAAFWGLQLYGVFSGATEAGPVRNSTIYSLLIFLLATWLFTPSYHNHGLWLSFILFSLARSLTLWMYLPRLNRMLFPNEGGSMVE